MLEMKCSRPVAAPPARVFAVVSDLRNAAGRVKGITKMEVLTDGPVRKGTRFRETRRMFGREATEEMEITAFDPPRSYTMECKNHGCHYVSEFRCKPDGAGTELEMVFQAHPLNLFAKVMGTLMRPFAKKLVAACSKDLDDLARAAEGRT
jgi:carbon monoxide dehydrogenase subunit G